MANNELVKFFHFERFDPEKEEWEYYLQRFEMEIKLHGLDTSQEENINRRRNLLLSKVGPNPFRILVDHFKPADITTKTYKDIVEVLNRYYGKQTYILSERVAFASRWRKDDESVTQYVTALRGLAGKCDFGTSLGERLRDQVVIGINNAAWQQELIRRHPSNSATLEEVEADANALEHADRQSSRLASFSLSYSDKHTQRNINITNTMKLKY